MRRELQERFQLSTTERAARACRNASMYYRFTTECGNCLKVSGQLHLGARIRIGSVLSSVLLPMLLPIPLSCIKGPKCRVLSSSVHRSTRSFLSVLSGTHVAFEPAAIAWPEIDEDSLKRLHSLPVWNRAVATERAAARTIQAWVPFESDALIREAIALQGYEEARHAAIIQGLTTHYGMPVSPPPPAPAPAEPEWAFASGV